MTIPRVQHPVNFLRLVLSGPISEIRRLESFFNGPALFEHAQQLADDPPRLIFHGDKDWLVPIKQAELMVEKLHKAGVAAKLVVKAGAEHGWPDFAKEMTMLVDWFDQFLKTPAKVAP